MKFRRVFHISAVLIKEELLNYVIIDLNLSSVVVYIRKKKLIYSPITSCTFTELNFVFTPNFYIFMSLNQLHSLLGQFTTLCDVI